MEYLTGAGIGLLVTLLVLVVRAIARTRASGTFGKLFAGFGTGVVVEIVLIVAAVIAISFALVGRSELSWVNLSGYFTVRLIALASDWWRLKRDGLA